MATTTTLAHIMAVVLTFRRLFVVWGVPPVLLLVTPFVLGIIFAGVGIFTSGWGISTTIMVALITVIWRSAIYTFAPSPKHRDEALQKSRIIFPLVSFVFVRGFILYMIVPIFNQLGVVRLLGLFSLKIPFIRIIRLTLCATLLGIAVSSRYIGPFSIVRCSAFPLVSHPISTTIRSFIAKCTSVDAFLDLLASPSDTPGVLLTSKILGDLSVGRRCQRPSNQGCLAQFTISTIIGYMVACVLSYGKPEEPSLGLVCGIACAASLLMSCLDGASHEIDPLRYVEFPPKLGNLSSHTQTFLVSVFVVPYMAVFMDNRGPISWRKVAHSMLVAFSSVLYMSALDILTRSTLCKHQVNLKGLVVELTGDISRETTLDTLLDIILFENGEVVEKIATPTKNAGSVLVEEEEVDRNRENMERMGKLLLDANALDRGFEDDFLRIMVLESFGGGKPTNEGPPDRHGTLGVPSKRHSQQIKDWVEGDKKLLVAQREPPVVRLVRALCAYAGGLGVALNTGIAKPKKPQDRFQNIIPSVYATWTLPPAALLSAEWSVTAATRFVVHSISMSGREAPDWRSGHLSMMVPVVLCAAFSLHRGVQNYLGLVEKLPSFASIRDDLVATRRARDTLMLCDDVALHILAKLRSLEGLRNVEVNVRDGECRAWLEGLLSRNLGEERRLTATTNSPESFSFWPAK